MDNKITGKEYSLSDIFSSKFEYYIPAYQRPYSWTEEETEILFDDLFEFFENKNQEDSYFLGSIVLIKQEDNRKSDVIDGQQRLTTLTILLAVIASYLSDDKKKECEVFLREPGNSILHLEKRPRLHIREKDQTFFNKYIQEVKLDELTALDSESLQDEPQKHIKENCRHLIEKMEKSFSKDENKIIKFLDVLINRCYLVAVCTPSQQSAFRVFSVLNSRGMDLMPTDIIKSDIIGQIPDKERQEYTDKWESIEDQTTRSGFNEVFTHIRMIFAKSKAKEGLYEEFKKIVLPKFSPKELIDDIIDPYSDAYCILKNKNYAAEKNAEEVNHYLSWVNKIDNSDWMPVAIKFMAEHKNEPEYVLWFTKKLERLAAYLLITEKNVNERIDRYRQILEEMEINPDHCISDPLSTIELTNTEKKEFKEKLDGDIYGMTPIRRNFVILRLNCFVSDGATGFDFNTKKSTIEHVLPQDVKSGSNWEKWWPDPEIRKHWINKIANLLLLTRQKNSEAQNKDFDYKKKNYYQGKYGTTSYPLTSQVLNVEEWTPGILEKRQKTLIDCFVENWELQYSDADDNGISSDDTSGTDVDIKEFNINDESTYACPNIPVGQLAYKLFERLLEQGKITDDEIEKLKEREYSRQLFDKMNYPILAEKREYLRGNGKTFRYRADPIKYKGEDLFFTIQWYDDDRNNVIAWYKKHNKK